MALEAGRIINDTYRVEKLLGAGGMAEVYKVVHTRLPKHFALKLMKLDGGERKQFLARFRREAEILGTLSHPHIVDVNDWNQLPDGSPYLIMELLEGEDLESFLKRAGQLTTAVTLHICKQIGEALQAAHQAGIVHRDLKPGNIFLSSNGPFPNYVKVLDFGVAKLFDSDKTPLTANATLMGTPAYMAPEQALGRIDEIDPRTDQFALASIVFEMLVGRPTFCQDGDSVYTILERIVQGPVPELPAHVPEHIGHALHRALSKKKEERFPSLKDFLASLGATSEAVLSSGASHVLSPHSTVEKLDEKLAEKLARSMDDKGDVRASQSGAKQPLKDLAVKGSDLSNDVTQPPRGAARSPLFYAAIGIVAALLLVLGLFAILAKK